MTAIFKPKQCYQQCSLTAVILRIRQKCNSCVIANKSAAHTPIKWKLLIVSIPFVTHVAQLQPTTSTVLQLKVML